MARLAKVVYEDSGDELPDLATMMKQHGSLKLNAQSTEPKASKTSIPANLSSKITHGDTNSDTENQAPKIANKKSRATQMEEPENPIKPKARNRILKPLSNNPLLLPLNNMRNSLTESNGKQETMVAKVDSQSKVALQRPTRKASKPAVRASMDSDREEDPYSDGSDGLSDFIVEDEYSSSEAVSDSDFGSPPPPPGSSRKLVRGRRPENRSPPAAIARPRQRLATKAVFKEESDDKKETSKTMTINDIMSAIDLVTSEDEAPQKPTLSKPKTELPKTDDYRPGTAGTSSGFDEPLPNLRFSPPKFRKPVKIRSKERNSTSPASPPLKGQSGLRSPTKLKLPRIPATPHRVSMDAFWNQDVVNNWNDEYSPRKATAPRSFGRLCKLAEDSETEDHITSFQTSPKKSATKQIQQAARVKKAFLQNKHEIASSFLHELDDIITKGQVTTMSASTGGIKIIWSKTLKTTAGRANWKREAIRARPLSTDVSSQISYHHHATIELAEKVIDDEERLLNVLAHEFCHLANFMVSGIKTNPHGKEFKEWAAKCSQAFGHRGIEVTTKHSYEIDYKYVWECENCGMEFKRHSKSIDPKRHQCGSCKSKLVQTKPVPRTNSTGVSGGMGEYQAFMKANMKLVREQNPGSPQKEIMGLIGKKYQEYKALKPVIQPKVSNGSDAIFVEKELPSIDAVARKLDFLDLGSP